MGKGKGKGVGLESKPPKLTPEEKVANKAAKAQKKANRPMKLAYLNKKQRINQTQRQFADNALGEFANSQLPGIQESYSQPFDWNALPERVVGDDFSAWRDQQIQQGNQAFDSRMNPVFQQQSEDFEQQMANRGIPMGSELYNREKTRMEQSQNDARQQGYFQAAQSAGQNASQFFDIGQSARSSAFGEDMTQRNMPLNEFQQMYGAMPGFAQQNLQYSQGRQMQSQAEAANQRLQDSAWHPAPSGGGGSAPVWQQYGYGSPQEYDAYQDSRSRANADYAASKQPGAPKGPSYGSQLGGSILGAAVGGWASGGFKPFW